MAQVSLITKSHSVPNVTSAKGEKLCSKLLVDSAAHPALGQLSCGDLTEEGMTIHSSILENPMDRAWWATVHRVMKKSDMTEET